MKGGSASSVKIDALANRIVLYASDVPSATTPKLSALHRSQWKDALLGVGNLLPPSIKELASAAKVNQALAAREVMRVSLAACATWFDRSASAGYGDVHRAAKPKIFVASEFIIHRNGSTSTTKNQVEYLAEKRQPWADKWNHNGEHDPELLRILAVFRAEAKEVPRDPLVVSDLDCALKSEAENKSRGLVPVTPSDLSRLPHAGKQ